MKVSSKLQKIHETYSNFKLVKCREIEEIQCILKEVEHIPTGAQILHIETEDPENAFCLSFPTYPDSSDGVAHILEHTVLCGSKKFPVKDPFFSMTRRSLNTFMNAMTGSDFTCYPAASQVPKDFYNLLEVYLDAVFFPKLDKLSFLQEGHRLDFEDSNLCFKGIVFNEMKGSLSNPQNRLWQSLMEHLVPDLIYRHNSGGDPKDIPKLSYQKLIDFHQNFYHPSRCLFYFYGNLPLEKHLDFIASEVLDQSNKLPPLRPLAKQKRFKKQRHFTCQYPLSPDEDPEEKTFIAFSWLTYSVLDQVDILLLQLVEIILMGTDAAILKNALLKSGLCKQASIYIDDDMSEVPTTLILKGSNPENADKLRQLILDVLKEFALKPPSLKEIEAAMFQLEFSRLEITGGSMPYGLSLFMRCALLKQHGGNSEDALLIHTLFKKLREKIQDTNTIKSFVEKTFLNNPHFLSLVMEPDKSLEKKEKHDEKKRLKSIEKELSNPDIERIKKESEDLNRLQEKQEDEDLEVLPKVSLKDVQAQTLDFLLSYEPHNSLDVYHHSCFTNDIIYANLIWELPEFSPKDLPYIQLFSLFATQVGCGKRNYKENLNYILEHIGAISCYYRHNPQVDNIDHTRPCFVIQGKSLSRKSRELFTLMRDLCLSINMLDKERLGQLISQHHCSLESNLNRHALKYALNTTAASFSKSAQMTNLMHGIPYLKMVRNVSDTFKESPDLFVESMERIEKKIFQFSKPKLILACDEKNYQTLCREKFYDLNLPQSNTALSSPPIFQLPEKQHQAYLITSPVAFTALACKGLTYKHADAPLISIASNLLSNKTLHKRIREQGGAYGSGASNSFFSGHFQFYSYRDPHLCSTLQAFRESVDMLVKGEFDNRDLEEAKLGILQDLDAPIYPGARAMTAFNWMFCGKDRQKRQNFRDGLIHAKKAAIQKAVKTHLDQALNQAALATFANEEFITSKNQELADKHLTTLKMHKL